MTYQRLSPATLATADDGTPWSDRYADLYHSAQGGLAQARHVFLGGNHLPAAWASRNQFQPWVILELGFGLGLNFLATWQAWQSDPQRPQALHFVAVEAHPFHQADLATALARWPELADLANALIRAWPPLVPGLHRLHFANGAVTLTLVFGDAAQMLPNLVVGANSLYLDGFSPDRNPALWSASTLAAATALAAPDATLATWSVAVPVREKLAALGWQLDRQPGFGNKKYMLTGHLPSHAGGSTISQTVIPTVNRTGCKPASDAVFQANDALPTPAARSRVAVIGAGVAGAAISQRLVARGFTVTVLERHAQPAQGASGNKAGVFRPQPAQDDGRIARLLRASFLYGKRHIKQLLADGSAVRHEFTGALHIAKDARHELVQQQVVADQSLPDDYVRFLDRQAATELATWPLAHGGWWFPGAGWVAPPSLCAANLQGIDVRYRCPVERLEFVNHAWQLLAADGRLLLEADMVVLANGVDMPALLRPLAGTLGFTVPPVRVGRGVVSHLPAAAVPPFHLVATRSGYVTPAIDGIHCAGATLHPDDLSAEPRVTDHAENLQRLDAILPGYGQNIAAEALEGRVGFRPMSPDRLPIVGAISATAGLWAINGFGARGLVWSALCAELLASQIAGEPLPVELDLCQALAPSRFGDKRKHSGKV